jgi:aryl-alcohol dehydrogenase-like predicted oxidoreductase
MAFEHRVKFGRTGLSVSKIGLGSSYGLRGAEVERAFERGVNFLFWGSRRRGSFGDGVRQLAKQHRENVVIAVQSYSRSAALMGCSVDRALKSLAVDHVDILCLAWWNDVPPQRILEKAYEVRESGKARHLMISCHHRPSFDAMLHAEIAMGVKPVESIMLRYNAAHPGAEQDVFPHLDGIPPASAPGVLAFTATRWGSLLDPKNIPPGERVPRASDCYRFALSNPRIHVSLAGPRTADELDAVFEALEKGPLDAEEDAWMRRVGKVVRNGPGDKLKTIDRLASPSSPECDTASVS